MKTGWAGGLGVGCGKECEAKRCGSGIKIEVGPLMIDMAGPVVVGAAEEKERVGLGGSTGDCSSPVEVVRR